MKLKKYGIITAMILTAAICCGIAWAATGATLDLSKITEDTVYIASENNVDSVTLSGDLGAYGVKVFGVSGDKDSAHLNVTLGSTVVISKDDKYDKAIQFFGGGANSKIKGDSVLVFDAKEGAILRTVKFSPNGEGGWGSILLAGGVNGGTIGGNAKMIINGDTINSDDIGTTYVKAFAAGAIDKACPVDSLTVEGDAIAEMHGSWGGKQSCTALLAGPMVSKSNSTAIVKGKCVSTIDGEKAGVREAYSAGFLQANGSNIFVQSTEFNLVKGLVQDTVFGGGAIWGKSQLTVSGDAAVNIVDGTFSQNSGRGRIFGGHDVEVDDGKGYVLGNTKITVSGGRGLNYVFGGGMAWGGKTTGTESIVKGNSYITFSGNSGIAALSNSAKVFAGGRAQYPASAVAKVEGNAYVTFKNITSTTFAGTLSGQGTDGGYNIDGYTDSVSGDSFLILDNVKADFSGVTIKHFDALELTPETDVKVDGAKFDTTNTKIKLTGNYTADTTLLTFSAGAPVALDIDYSKAFGVEKAAYADGKITVTVKKTVPAEPVAKPVDPVVPVGVSADVKAATSTDVVSGDVAKAETLIVKTGIKSADLVVNKETGTVTVAPTVVLSALKASEVKGDTVSPMPVFVSKGETGKVIGTTMVLMGKDLYAKTTGDIRIAKLLSADKVVEFKQAATAEQCTDQTFSVFAATGNEIYSGDIKSSDVYKVTLYIKDGGSFDLDTTAGQVTDPAVIVGTTAAPTPTKNSSNGCNAGFAALVLLAIVPVIYRKKK